MPVAGARPWSALLLSAWLTACAWAATPIDPAPAGGTGLTVAGALRLPRTEVDGLALAGLSALAWDADEQRLYAVSDFGRLFHLRPVFDGGRLVDAELLAGFPLTDARGRALRPPWTDAEGLTLRHGTNGIRGDSELLISYERRPRIRRYTPEGRRLDGLALPPPLADVNAYADPNQALEALTRLPQGGLLTGPERPLRGRETIDLYALDGRHWHYRPRDTPNSALVELETLPDGSLLALERAFQGRLQPLVVALRRVELHADGRAEATDLAVLSSGQGWALDNFEGLAHHRGRYVFLVSDDNDSVWQNTLLFHLRLPPP